MPADAVTDYAKAVIGGQIIAGEAVRNACNRHLIDLQNGEQRGLYFDLEAANRAIGFCRDMLRLNGGQHEGVPFELLPWQAFIMGSLFGWKGANGYRRFRHAYIETAKGSGKSPLAAAIGLYGLVADGEARAEIYAAATKTDQAQILFRDAVAMVDQSPHLSEILIKRGNYERTWNLSYPDTGSFFKTISSDEGQSGPRPHIALIDEVHEHKTRHVIEMMEAGTKSRRQALIVMITNSGHDRASICYEMHEYGRLLNAGMKEPNDSYFAYICMLDAGDDAFNDERCWIKVNPSLNDKDGGLPGYDYLRKQVAGAKGMPARENNVKRLNFCQWTDSVDAWIGSDVWLKAESEFTLDSIPKDEPCYGGLDLSSNRDLTALALYFPSLEQAFVEFWTPRDGILDKERKDNVPYTLWHRQGHIHLAGSALIDYADLAGRLVELSQRFKIEILAFDKYRIEGAKKYFQEQRLQIELVEHPQGFQKLQKSPLWMPDSIEKLEKKLKEGVLKVKKNPCLRWNAASAVLETDSKDNRAFTKKKPTGRIDGIVALAMAVGAGCAGLKGAPEVDISAHIMQYGVRTVTWG